ncbi:MAG: DUF2946 family protein [Pseudomonadota bacterium]|uniref:DUF2946 domain-containing protein n=1 Tax=hydrothermal vent metagenome TaxID=652676 RepID=A0A170PPC2_9ZZZZ
MTALRRHFLRHRLLAGWIVAAGLLMKLLVPAGYMPMASGGSIIIQICSGYGPMTMAMPIPGKEDQSGQDGQQGKAEMPCAYSGLSTPSLAAADPLLLALAVLFVMVAATRAAIPIPAAPPPHLRPPLRGPPATA